MTTRTAPDDLPRRGPWDAIVIGAGLAGAAASYQLAKQGRQVLLVEAKPFPRGKVCGGCLNARAIGVFDQLGLADLLRTAGGVPYEQMRLHAGGRSVRLPIPAGLAVTRETLDKLLVEAAVAAGVTFVDGVQAHVLPAGDDNFRSVRLGKSHSEHAPVIQGRIVLACDGLGRPSLAEVPGLQPQVSSGSRIGLGAIVPEATLRSIRPAEALQMVVGRDGYVGFSQCEEGRISVAAAVDRKAVSAGTKPAEAIARILNQAKIAEEPSLLAAAWRGTKPLSQRCGRVADHRLLLLGDAAGYVEPFTGEGMAAALEGSQLAAGIASQGWTPRMAQSWQDTYTTAVRSRQRACSRLAWLLRRPRLTHLVLRLLEQWPSLGARTAQRISSERTHHKEFASWAHR